MLLGYPTFLFFHFPFFSWVVITGEQEGEPVKDSKTSISVSAGGIKCLVGSQYVSNHDFLEVNLFLHFYSKASKPLM